MSDFVASKTVILVLTTVRVKEGPKPSKTLMLFIMSRWNQTKPLLGNGIERNWLVWAEHAAKNGHNTSRGTKKWFYSMKTFGHMFLQAIDELQLQISSNWRSKSKVPANDAYPAQNSTFSHTKEYIILNKNSLIFQGYAVDICPSLRQWRFTSVNFNQNFLVTPTFVKQRKLICTPDRSKTYCNLLVVDSGN